MAIPGPREWSKNQKVVQTMATLSTVPSLVLDYDADRVSLLLSCGSSITVWVAFEGGLPQSNGVGLQSSTPPLILNFAQHGDLVKQQVWGSAGSPGAKLYCVETIWLPSTGE